MLILLITKVFGKWKALNKSGQQKDIEYRITLDYGQMKRTDRISQYRTSDYLYLAFVCERSFDRSNQKTPH